MKRKNLAWLLVGILALAGCDQGSVSPSEEPSSPSVQPSSPSVEESSPSVEDSSDPESSPSIEDSTQPSVPDVPVVEHQDPLVRDVEDGAALRNYKSDFDSMVDDFSGATLQGTNENGSVVTHDKLRVLVDSANDDFPESPDEAIYKMATGAYELHKFEGIGFKIRKVGEGTLDLSNLVLGLRGGDAYKVFELNLADAVNPDGEALNELTDEWQDIVVCPNLSIEDDTTEYQMLESGEASGLKVLEMILGFHLYATGEVSQLIEIEEVFITQAGEKTVLDSFARTAVNKVDDTCWWRDSTGFIVNKGVTLDNGASYQTANIDNAADFENLVLNISGNSSELSVAPVTATGQGTAVPWASLKDQDGNPVKGAVNGSFNSFVINLANSGIPTEGVIGYKLISESEVHVSQIFLSNLVDKAAVTVYPELDAKNAAMFDNFNRTQSGFDGDYDKSSTNQIVIDAGLNYALSYNNGDKITVADGHVTFDATTLAESDYINFKEGRAIYDGQQYLVLSVKGEEGATLDGFRIDVGNGAVWSHSWYSASGLKVPSLDATNYPYTTADGYKWLVIDLKESGMDPAAKTDQAIDMYYSGTGKFMIDSIFYADVVGVAMKETEVINATIADLSGYNYVGGFDNTTANLLKMTFKSNTEGQTLKSIRLGMPGGEFWFKDGKLIDENGNVIPGDTPVTAEGTTVVIDLTASGIETLAGAIHVHSGGFDGSAGDISVVVSTLQEAQDPVIETEVINATIADLSGYNYVGGFDNTTANLLKMTFKSNTEGQTLKSIRLGMPGGEFWFKDGKLIDENGNVIPGDTPVTAEGTTVVIDLTASGIETLAGAIHVHSGGFDGSAGDITVIASTVEPAGEPMVETQVLTDITVGDITGYAYVGGFDNPGINLIKVTVKSNTEGQTLKSVRIEAGGAQYWFKDNAVIGEDGNPIPADTAVTAEGTTFVIDLTATGVENLVGPVHVHSGGFDGSAGDLTFNAWTVEEPSSTIETQVLTGITVGDISGYAYVGGFDNPGVGLLKLTISSNTEGQTLKSVRIEAGGAQYWFKDNVVIGEDGKPISADTAITAEGTTIVIDLSATGVENLVGPVHVHSGGFDSSAGDLTFNGWLVEVEDVYEDIMGELQQ